MKSCSVKKNFSFWWLVLFGMACNKTSLDKLSFDVRTSASTYKAGSTVDFEIMGNADYIVFYSGEKGDSIRNGSRFSLRDRITAEGAPKLNFLTYRQFGNHLNTLQLMVSTDFSGVYDSVNVRNATWNEITSRANLSVGKDSTPSGTIDLSDFKKGDTPVYIAFRYYDFKDGLTSQRAWTIRNLSLINQLPDSTSSRLLDMSPSSWSAVDMQNKSARWSLSTAQFRISGGPKDSATNEDWLVSQPLRLNRVQPDAGVSIKTLVEPSLKSFSYKFTSPRTYTVVFEAFKSNKSASEGTTRTLELTIVP